MNESIVNSLVNQWGITALFMFMKDSGVQSDYLKESIESNTLEISKHIKKFPARYDELEQSDISHYKSSIENLISTLTNNESTVQTLNMLSIALREAITFGAKILNPNKEVLRERAALKSGLWIPESFFGSIQTYLCFFQKLLETVKPDEIKELSDDLFNLMYDILLKRKQMFGLEGTILSIMSSSTQRASSLWSTIMQIAKTKDDKKAKNKLTMIVKGINTIRCNNQSEEIPKTIEQLKDISSNITLLKGKWSMPIVLPILSTSFVYFLSHFKDEAKNVAEYLSSVLQTELIHTIQNPSQETYSCLIDLIPYSSESDFNSIIPKLIQNLNKNYPKLSPTVYFQAITQLLDGCSCRTNSTLLFNVLINHWFGSIKQFSINPIYKDDIFLMINVIPSLFSAAPKETEELLIRMLNSSTVIRNFALSAIHLLSFKEGTKLLEIAKTMYPIVKAIIEQEEIPGEELQLLVPVLSLLWQLIPESHSDITNLMVRCSKTKDIIVLGHAGFFFSEIMEHYPVGSMPVKILITFSAQFLRRVDECVLDPNVSKNFKLYQTFAKSFIKYTQRSEDAIDEQSWSQFLSQCENRLIAYSVFPDKNIIEVVQDIWEMLSSEKIVFRSINPPLASILPDITHNTAANLSKHTDFPGFPQRYISLATYFAKSENNISKEFKLALSKLLTALYNPKYFESSEQLHSQLIPILCSSFANYSKNDAFELICLTNTDAWENLVDEVVNRSQIPLPSKIRFAWSLSSHLKFCSKVISSETLRKNLDSIFEAFLQSQLPRNEIEQETEVCGAEFSATFIRTISKQFSDEQIFDNFQDTINKIISRLNPDSITLPDISYLFALLELMHALIDTKSIDNETVESVLDWTLYIALKTKGSILLQLKCHDIVLSLVNKNVQSLPMIMHCCFRASALTTAHVASAIISSSSGIDLDILALGLSSRPSMICRAIAAEIANKSAGGKFSPLSCINPFFEEEICSFYASSFTSESVRKLMQQIPSLLAASESEPSSVKHFGLLQKRLAKITKPETILTLLHLTAITEFSDLTPIKPLIPIWDKLFENPPIELEKILQTILDEVKSITDAKMLTACCISFSRAFLKYPKPTATFIIKGLRILTDPKLSFDGFIPTTSELVLSAILSFIFALESDRQRFVVCFLDHIKFILVWAIYLRFNPLYEHHHLPPLVTSVMHAAVPDSKLELFVMAPSECVAHAVYLPFRHTTELTPAQISAFLDTLKSFSKLTAELFLDTVVQKANSLAKFSPDFWLLFSNFFQPIHSTSFLNQFILNAQNVDLETASMMLPILTGIVKQNADPSHISGFMTVIIFIISSTNDFNFLKKINTHLPKFVDTVINSEDSEIISSTLATIIEEHGGEQGIVEGILPIILSATKLNSQEINESLKYLKEIARLFSISNATFSYITIILYLFDSFRMLENKGKECMICLHLLDNIQVPENYKQLSSLLLKHWVQKINAYAVKYIFQFISKTNIIHAGFKKDLLLLIKDMSNGWSNLEMLTEPNKIRLLIFMTMVGNDVETSCTLANLFSEFNNKVGGSDELDIVEYMNPLNSIKVESKIRKSISTKSTPNFLDESGKHSLSEVCEYIQNNILN